MAGPLGNNLDEKPPHAMLISLEWTRCVIDSLARRLMQAPATANSTSRYDGHERGNRRRTSLDAHDLHFGRRGQREHYGALLVEALQQRLAAAGQTARFLGMGGTRMEAAGLERVVHSEDMAVMGLTEVIRHLPPHLRASSAS